MPNKHVLKLEPRVKRSLTWVVRPVWKNWLCICIILAVGMAIVHLPAVASSRLGLTLESTQVNLWVTLNTLWLLIATVLGFIMMLGLGLLAAGSCRQKNVVNVLTQFLVTVALSSVIFWLWGFALLFGDGTPLFGTQGWFLGGGDNSPLTGLDYVGVFPSLSWAAVPLVAKFLFQLMLAAIAINIIAGVVAERLQFRAFVGFTILFLTAIYPVTGHWIWGNGWLAQLGFWDFAGVTVVHVVAGWAAFVGTVLIGPRLGKYQQKESFALPGHNLPLVAIGGGLIWVGSFGFNGGALMTADSSAIVHIILVTNLAAAMAGLSALLMTCFYFGKPDLSIIVNGIVGGVVAISGICRYVHFGWAVIIGAIAGVLVVLSVDYLDRAKIDDPVGSLSTHLICGFWGTIAIALFAWGEDVPLESRAILYSIGPSRGILLGGGLPAWRQLLVQLLGLAVVSLSTIVLSWIAWSAIRAVIGLRVSLTAEINGLDISEHSLNAYSNFVIKPEEPIPPASEPEE